LQGPGRPHQRTHLGPRSVAANGSGCPACTAAAAAATAAAAGARTPGALVARSTAPGAPRGVVDRGRGPGSPNLRTGEGGHRGGHTHTRWAPACAHDGQQWAQGGAAGTLAHGRRGSARSTKRCAVGRRTGGGAGTGAGRCMRTSRPCRRRGHPWPARPGPHLRGGRARRAGEGGVLQSRCTTTGQRKHSTARSAQSPWRLRKRETGDRQTQVTRHTTDWARRATRNARNMLAHTRTRAGTRGLHTRAHALPSAVTHFSPPPRCAPAHNRRRTHAPDAAAGRWITGPYVAFPAPPAAAPAWTSPASGSGGAVLGGRLPDVAGAARWDTTRGMEGTGAGSPPPGTCRCTGEYSTCRSAAQPRRPHAGHTLGCRRSVQAGTARAMRLVLQPRGRGTRGSHPRTPIARPPDPTAPPCANPPPAVASRPCRAVHRKRHLEAPVLPPCLHCSQCARPRLRVRGLTADGDDGAREGGGGGAATHLEPQDVAAGYSGQQAVVHAVVHHHCRAHRQRHVYKRGAGSGRGAFTHSAARGRAGQTGGGGYTVCACVRVGSPPPCACKKTHAARARAPADLTHTCGRSQRAKQHDTHCAAASAP
jgi:hypothetical protein